MKLGKIQKRQLGVSIATLVVAVIGVIVAIYIRTTVVIVQSSVTEVGNRVEAVGKSILADQFTITHPVDGATVDLVDLIRGKTPFPEMNHYIVVTPLETGDDWVQDGPVKVFGGLWTGRASFGEAAVGAGEQFVVRALATKSTLSPGPLTEVPEDAISSKSVIVIRKR